MHPIVSYYMADNARYVSQPGDSFSASGLLALSSIFSAVKSSTFRRKLAIRSEIKLHICISWPTISSYRINVH